MKSFTILSVMAVSLGPVVVASYDPCSGNYSTMNMTDMNMTDMNMTYTMNMTDVNMTDVNMTDTNMTVPICNETEFETEFDRTTVVPASSTASVGFSMEPPTRTPTKAPSTTQSPTIVSTPNPTRRPTERPTLPPTPVPTNPPTPLPTPNPTNQACDFCIQAEDNSISFPDEETPFTTGNGIRLTCAERLAVVNDRTEPDCGDHTGIVDGLMGGNGAGSNWDIDLEALCGCDRVPVQPGLCGLCPDGWDLVADNRSPDFADLTCGGLDWILQSTININNCDEIGNAVPNSVSSCCVPSCFLCLGMEDNFNRDRFIPVTLDGGFGIQTCGNLDASLRDSGSCENYDGSLSGLDLQSYCQCDDVEWSLEICSDDLEMCEGNFTYSGNEDVMVEGLTCDEWDQLQTSIVDPNECGILDSVFLACCFDPL